MLSARKSLESIADLVASTQPTLTIFTESLEYDGNFSFLQQKKTIKQHMTVCRETGGDETKTRNPKKTISNTSPKRAGLILQNCYVVFCIHAVICLLFEVSFRVISVQFLRLFICSLVGKGGFDELNYNLIINARVYMEL